MPLNIKAEEAYYLAQALAKKAGTSLTDAVTKALREALYREERNGERKSNGSYRILQQ